MVDDFDEAVRRALDSLPQEIAARLENVAVVVEDENPHAPNLLGLFESAPLMPRKVTIYRQPLEEDFGHDPIELERQIQITVLHELAHYFGLEEQRLEELGYE